MRPMTDLTSDALTLVATALDHIDRAQGPIALAELADAAGYSPDHLARVFRRHVGVTPARYQAHLRAETGRKLLQDRSVLDATIALGESSPARVHDLLVTVEAVTPGEARRGGDGVTIRHGVHPSTLGPMLIATTDRGVVQIAFTRDVSDSEALHDVTARWPMATLVGDTPGTAAVSAQVAAAIAGSTNADAPLPLLLRGTNLQLAVWRALLRLPEGAAIAYGELAEAVGHPTAVRAVASAVGRNPVAPLIPCHRVLRANGALGGYRWGLTIKRRLLAMESARGDDAKQTPLAQATLPV
ncbi:MAG: AraC family transcriptional regulator of adaptative response [Nitriliruptoraceae bacterium]|jgi:AraC family transcriptional regulator of adaptative response/methylated-DNA-[protein]-cysteine methyltransferase